MNRRIGAMDQLKRIRVLLQNRGADKILGQSVSAEA